MHIDFGWEFDHRADTTSTTVGTVRCGPQGFATTLATRLGLQAPQLTAPERIVAYRSALHNAVAAGRADWCAESCAKNPWAMAQALLRWRDELVANGWRPEGDVPTDSASRLAVIDLIERMNTVPAGAADSIRAVAQALWEMSSKGQSWPVGISTISLHFCRIDELPRIWQEIFSGLQAQGVQVDEVAQVSRLESLDIITADTIYECATSAARILAQSEHQTILTGAATTALDHELALRNQAAIGYGESAPTPTLPVFLAACTRPHDIRALSTLTMLRYSTGSLIPNFVGNRIRSLLNRAAGVGSAEWAEEFETGALAQDELARDIDQLVRLQPLEDTDVLSAEDLLPHLEWLRARLLKLGQSFEAEVVAQARNVLSTAGTLSRRELDSILEALSAHCPALPQAQPGRSVAQHPVALPLGCQEVLWWAPIDNTVSVAQDFTQVEVAQLAQAGVHLPIPSSLAPLVISGQLGILTTARSITAVIPSYFSGEETSRHPLLNLLLSKVRDALPSTESGKASVTEIAKKVTSRAGALVQGDTWSFRGLRLPVTLPAIAALPAGNPFYREFSPAAHLLPERLSYSLMVDIIQHPLEWLLRRRLGIDPGVAMNLPGGNQLYGTVVHKVFEDLHAKNATAAEVEKAFNSALEGYGAELTLKGQESARKRLLGDTTRAVADINAAVRAMGATISGNETPITGVTLPELPGREGAPVELRGQRDVDLDFGGGRIGLFDLKYTTSKNKFSDEISKNQEMQLAVYARSLAGTAKGLGSYPVAYYSILQTRFFSPFPIFSPPYTGPASLPEDSLTPLWDRMVYHVNYVLDGLRQGWVFDLDNFRSLDKKDQAAFPEFSTRVTELEARGMATRAASPYTAFDFLTGNKGDQA